MTQFEALLFWIGRERRTWAEIILHLMKSEDICCAVSSWKGILFFNDWVVILGERVERVVPTVGCIFTGEYSYLPYLLLFVRGHRAISFRSHSVLFAWRDCSWNLSFLTRMARSLFNICLYHSHDVIIFGACLCRPLWHDAWWSTGGHSGINSRSRLSSLALYSHSHFHQYTESSLAVFTTTPKTDPSVPFSSSLVYVEQFLNRLHKGAEFSTTWDTMIT